MKKYRELLKLKNVKSVCLIGHLNPDVDAIASMLVFKNFLTSKLNVKEVDIFADTKGHIDSQCEYILGEDKINPKPSNYDFAIVMDCPKATEDRLGIYKPLFDNANFKFVIDHHDTNEKFGNVNYVEVVSSTCEIVYNILSSYKYKFSDDDLKKIYSGIVTDTGNFSVGAFNSKTYEIGSACCKQIDVKPIRDALMSNLSFKNLKTFGLAISNAKTYENDQIMITSISKEEVEENNISEDDCIAIINRLAQTAKVKLVSFIHYKNDQYYVSMRAKPEYDISVFAKNSGGGGHKGAAAFNSNEPLEKLKSNVLENFIKILRENNK